MQSSNTERYLFLTCVTVGADAGGSPARELWGLFSLENYQYPISFCGVWGEGGTDDRVRRVYSRRGTSRRWVKDPDSLSPPSSGVGWERNGERREGRRRGREVESEWSERTVSRSLSLGWVSCRCSAIYVGVPSLTTVAAFSVYIFDPAVVVDVFVACDKVTAVSY